MSNTDCAMVISDSNSPTKPSTYSFPTLKIPQVFVDQYLWDPNGDNNASDSVQGHASPDAADSSELKLPASEPSFRYNHSPSLIADTEVAVSYAFLQASKLHRATQSKPGPKPSDFPPEMGVTLYSPYHGGNAVLDSMVRILAEKHNADVLVLDSLELAAGKFSLLGEGTASCLPCAFSLILMNSKIAIGSLTCSTSQKPNTRPSRTKQMR